MDVFQNMELLSELIQCGGNIYTWCYNADGSLLRESASNHTIGEYRSVS